MNGLAVACRRVVHIYRADAGDVVALAGVDLSIGPGEMLALVGPSGSGKSTLVALLSGLMRASAGRVNVGTYDLGAGNWKPINRNKPEKGYTYTKGNPIKMVLVKPGKQIKIQGKGAGLNHSLATDPGQVNVELRLGGHRYCMSFGGQRTFTQGKKFLATNAAAATACPLDSP